MPPSAIEIKLKTKLFHNRFKYKQNVRRTHDKIIVETEYGRIEGIKRNSVWRKSFYSFESVPFAKPPVGLLRFRDPLPPEPWDGVLDCTKEADGPIQWNKIFQHVEGSEDCLYLSIYTPNIQPDRLLPVMVWIHGGAFETGSTSKDTYAPDYFIDKDIILVLVSYRVSIFGFLSLKDPIFGIPGNAALRDQILALKWIKTNISAFGGNPHNITVFGHDAGAVCINFLLMSEQATGLFHKAILIAGSAYCPWACQPPSTDWTERLLRLMGYKKELDECKVLEFLEHADPYDILSKMSKVLNCNEQWSKIFIPTGPIIEPYIGTNPVITKSPIHMAREAWGNHIPVIVGGSSFEGLIWYPSLKKNNMEFEQVGDCEHLIPKEVRLDPNGPQYKAYGELLRRTYFGKSAPTLLSYLKLLSHKLFWQGLRRFYLARMKYAHDDTYLFRFDFDSPTFNHHRILYCGKEIRGVSHSDILSYLFYNSIAEDVPPETIEYKIIKIMTTMCTQFAMTGNPNNQEWYPLHWKPAVTKPNARIMCLNISNKMRIVDLPENEFIDVWDSMFPRNKLI